MDKYIENEMWAKITKEFGVVNQELVDDFKNSAINNRISQYNFRTHGLFFYKTLLFYVAENTNRSDLELLNLIDNRHVGQPISIQYDKLELDMDYLQAIREYVFLKEELQVVKSIIEIGAGYGRTCHTILSLCNNVKDYIIVDLPNVLSISQKYLFNVLKRDLFNKIKFIPNNLFEPSNIKAMPELAINIDSMQEMDSTVASNYLNCINENCSLFYSKNTVAKFYPELVGGAMSDAVELALQAGLLTEKINIFTPKDLNAAQSKFLTVFNPGEKWQPVKHGKVLPWTHYYQAMYKKE